MPHCSIMSMAILRPHFGLISLNQIQIWKEYWTTSVFPPQNLKEVNKMQQTAEKQKQLNLNGVNVDQLFGNIDAIKNAPALGKFKFRANNKCIGETVTLDVQRSNILRKVEINIMDIS